MRKGLTLLELVVVLVILALLATVAVTMVEPRVDQKRFELTQKLVEDVEVSIYRKESNVNGTTFDTGFVVDMGGLPQAFLEADGSLSLRQLFQNVEILSSTPAAFSIRNASSANIANATDSDSEAVAADQQVSMGTGWRGPYMKLAVGANSLNDPWGNLIRSFPASGTYSHLRGPNDTDIAAEGDSIIGIRSLGKDDDIGGADYNSDLPNVLQLSTSQLFGELTGSALVPTGTTSNASEIIVQAFYPDIETGLIRIEKGSVSGPFTTTNGFDEFTFEFVDSSSNPVKFPVGQRAVRAYYNQSSDTGDFSDGTNDPHKSKTHYFNLQPNVNNVSNIIINVN